MYLSDVDIKNCLDDGRIEIEPAVDPADVRPVGIRIKLGNEILVPQGNQKVDPRQEIELEYEKHELGKNGYWLKPGQFILATSQEKVRVDRTLLAFVEGRSTIARLGLTIHATSGVLDGMYDKPKSAVLEIRNLGNFEVLLVAGYPVGMFLFAQLSSPTVQQVQDQYMNQTSVMAPNLKKQFM